MQDEPFQSVEKNMSDSRDSAEIPEIPSSKGLDAIMQLVAVARRLLAKRGLEHIVEYSDRSEAVYLHVLRDHHWYGVRIANHQPAYACSLDYQQLILQSLPYPHQLERAAEQLRNTIYSGGAIVADPREVQQLIDFTRLRKADGYETADSDGVQWRWNGQTRQWETLAEDFVDLTPPGFQPRSPLSHLECSDLRHRLNLIARWTFDELRNSTQDR